MVEDGGSELVATTQLPSKERDRDLWLVGIGGAIVGIGVSTLWGALTG